MPNRLIAWDVDDVLNNLMESWFTQKWLKEKRDCSLNYESLTINPPHTLLGITKRGYLESLDEFRLAQYNKLAPNQTIIAWLERWGHHFRHIALTATPRKSASITANWVLRHFGKWIRTFHFIPSIRPDEPLPEYDSSKADFLKLFNCPCILIDDSPANVETCRQNGINAILWPAPWNRALGAPPDQVLSTVTEFFYMVDRDDKGF